MKHNIILTVAVAILSGFALQIVFAVGSPEVIEASAVLEKVGSEGYALVWTDEFEKDGKLDPKNWGYEYGFLRNAEEQLYQEENAFCEDGKLIIEARRERKPNPNYKKGSPNLKERLPFANYTSASVITKGLHSWQYGRFEVKAKVKAESGLWPAIWFLGVEGRWPSNGEIDLMEYYKGDIHANACWASNQLNKPRWDSSKTPITSFGRNNWDDEFHIWRMDWDETSIKLYVDNQLLNTIELKKTINESGNGPKNPFKQPAYLLLNLAVGGINGGDPKDTAFPSRYEIDYVRVYQK